ncbi:MAG: cadherin-like domain-containing protein, partial [Acidobacteriota bacterium]|nr:cadherin-like domain-containing protein [Acidobacteriota bacterium]
QDTVGSFILNGSAPCTGECDGVDDVELTFSIVAGSGPSSGVLGPLTQGSEVPQRTASVDYTPNAGFTGTDGFDFQVAGDLNGDLDTDDPGETSTASVTIEVEAIAPPQPPVADPVVATTEMDTEVSIGLSGAPGTGPLPLTLPFAALPAAGSGANGGRPGEGAAGGTRAGPTPIVIGAGWTATTAVPPAFFWEGTPPILSPDGPFTFDGEACVSVTDDFLKGDQFRLLDNGQDLGTTPLVPVDASSLPVGPDAAYADPTYSSGTFEVGEGSHAIDIEIVPPNSFDIGQGYIRVDPLDSAFCSDTCGLTFSIQSPPSNGTLGLISQTSSTTAQILYTPYQGFVGIDSFAYGVTDCFGNLASALVDLIILDVNACTNCYTLTVQLAGAGAGDVTSNPTGIACPSSACAADFTQNSAVVLQARPVDEFVFGGWSGDCSGGSPLLTVVLNGDKTCVATFDP